MSPFMNWQERQSFLRQIGQEHYGPIQTQRKEPVKAKTDSNRNNTQSFQEDTTSYKKVKL